MKLKAADLGDAGARYTCLGKPDRGTRRLTRPRFGAQFLDYRLKPVGPAFKIVFPDADHSNSFSSQGTRNLAVAPHITENLFLPKRRIVNGLGEAPLAGVPEAAIQEDCGSEIGKEDVGSPWNVGRMEFPPTNAIGPEDGCHSALG